MDRADTYLLGFGCGLVLGILALLATDASHAPMRERDANLSAMVAQCEATLPRNETCVLVAQRKAQ